MILIHHLRKDKAEEVALETLREAVGISTKALNSNEPLKKALQKIAKDADIIRLLDRTDREGILIYQKRRG